MKPKVVQIIEYKGDPNATMPLTGTFDKTTRAILGDKYVDESQARVREAEKERVAREGVPGGSPPESDDVDYEKWNPALSMRDKPLPKSLQVAMAVAENNPGTGPLVKAAKGASDLFMGSTPEQREERAKQAEEEYWKRVAARKDWLANRKVVDAGEL